MKPKNRMYARNNVIDQLEDGYLYISTSSDDEEVTYVIGLVKKDIPKKPIYENDLVDENVVVNTWAYCPNCKEEIPFELWENLNYCPNCGQRLDWSDEE